MVVLFVLIGLFVLLPLAELWVIVGVAGSIGLPATILALVMFSVLGGFLVRREGLSAWKRASTQLESGQIPVSEIANGLLIMGGGTLLLTPGFITDIVGLALLIPFTRALIRPLLAKALLTRMSKTSSTGFAANFGRMGSRTTTAPDASASPKSPPASATVVDVEVNRPDSLGTP